jgi:hypothetical protein
MNVRKAGKSEIQVLSEKPLSSKRLAEERQIIQDDAPFPLRNVKGVQ